MIDMIYAMGMMLLTIIFGGIMMLTPAIFDKIMRWLEK